MLTEATIFSNDSKWASRISKCVKGQKKETKVQIFRKSQTLAVLTCVVAAKIKITNLNNGFDFF